MSSPEVTNYLALYAKGQQAITNNETFLAIPSPTQAQAVTQVQALTRQIDAVIRVLLGVLTDTTGT